MSSDYSPINKGMPLTPTPSIRNIYGRHPPASHANSMYAESKAPTPSIANTRASSARWHRRSTRRPSPASSRRSMQTPVLMVSDMDDGGSLILSSGNDDDDATKSPEKPKWNTPERHLIAIKFVYLFVYANTACLIPYFVTFYIEWGLTPTELSLIQAAVPFFGFLVRPIIGRLADVTNCHRAVFAACCLWCAFFHIPHMFIPKLSPLSETTNQCENHHHSSCLHSNSSDAFNFSNGSNVTSSSINLLNFSTSTTAMSTTSDSMFSNSDRLPTLTLLLGLRLVAYAGQAPTQDLADAFCYAAVDRDPRRWGRQRVWSTVGWACATFSVGYLLNELGSHYWLFVITAVFNVLAAIAIMFLEPLSEGSPAMMGHGGAHGGGARSQTSRSMSSKTSHRSQTYRPATASSTSTTGAYSASSRMSSAAMSTYSTSTFDTTTPLMSTLVSRHETLSVSPPATPTAPQITLTMLLKQRHVQIYLFFSILSGSLLAIEFSFLLIFLKDSGGDEMLIGLHQVVDSFSEFPLFLFSGYIITWLGFVPCFCLSFCTYILRLVCYSFLTDPLYLVLIVEIVHCFSFTLYVAAGTGYADSITAPGLEATLQSLFQGVFFGLGIGAGNLIGGFLYPVIGPRWLFRGAAILAALCAISYAAIYFSGYLNKRSSGKPIYQITGNLSNVSTHETAATPSTVLAFGANYTMSIKTIDNDGSTLTGGDTQSLDRRSNSLLIPPTPIPMSELFHAPDGLHRSPGVGRVPMIVMMTPLTARIIAKDGVIRFIDD